MNMSWMLEEALDYYRRQGAPNNQMVLVNLLKEIQQENGGALPKSVVSAVAEAYGVKEALLLAVIKRMPSLRLQDTHCLEICGGKSCAARARLISFVEKTYGEQPKQFTVKYVNCLRQCGTGPNIRWDGTLYSHADESLIRKLVENRD